MTTPPQLPGYRLVSCLGQGAFGTVYQAVWEEGFACAVKVLEEGSLHAAYLGNVLERLQALPPHEGLLPVYAFDLEDGVPHLSMPLMEGGAVTFDDLTGKLTREEAWELLRQVAETLGWLHKKGLVHAGLTGGNIFVVAAEDGSARALITDIGQAWLGEGSMTRLHDQAPYVPPERWMEPARVLLDGKAETWDVYAFGVLAWRLLNGCWPRARRLFDQVLASKGAPLAVDPPAFAEWLRGEPAPVWPQQIKEPERETARRMILRCLALDPLERPASMALVAEVFDEGGAVEPVLGLKLKAVLPAVVSGEFVATAPVSAAPESLAGESAAPVPAGLDHFSAELPLPAPSAQAVVSGLPVKSGAGRRLALAASLLVGLGGGFAALQHRGEAQRFQRDFEKARDQAAAHRSRMEAAEGRVAALEKERAAGHLSQLARSRDEWAAVVSGLMQSRPTEPAVPEAWKAAVSPVGERLKSALTAADAQPVLVETSMEPRWQLARLYAALGHRDDALPLLERVARDLETAAPTSAPDAEARLLLTARAAGRRGAILLENRRTMDAAPLLQRASQVYETWLGRHTGRHEIAREYAETSLLEGRAMAERRQADDARTAFQRVGTLLGQAGDPGFIPQDHFTLSDALVELSALDGAGGNLNGAISHLMEAVRLLVAYDQANRQSVPCRRRLVDGYFGLGKLLTKNGTPRDASVAFNEAAKLLTELTNENPAETSFRLQLALTYNEVAQLVGTSRPNAAGAAEALAYQNFSLTYLRNLNETITPDSAFRRHLAAALVLNGKLQETAGEGKQALNRHQEALALLDEILAEPTLSEADRRECRRLSASAWAAMGGMQEKSGKKDDAIASLSKALEAWTESAGEDPAADQIVASTRERLRKLKPSG